MSTLFRKGSQSREAERPFPKVTPPQGTFSTETGDGEYFAAIKTSVAVLASDFSKGLQECSLSC